MNLHDVKTRIDEISQKYIPKYVPVPPVYIPFISFVSCRFWQTTFSKSFYVLNESFEVSLLDEFCHSYRKLRR